MKLVPCIEMLYKAEHPDFISRFHSAKADGFDAVDMWLWRDKPLDAVVDVAAETGVQVCSFCVDPRASLTDPAEQATVLLEPVHMVIGGNLMFVHTVRHGLDLVEAVDSPALRLLADVYHGAVTGETFAQAFADRIALVGHVQVADHEGRHEPGADSLPWATLLPLLQARGYTGPIGLEYLPSLPIADSLAPTRRTLGL